MAYSAPHQIVEQLGAQLADERAALMSNDGDALERAALAKSRCLPELAAALAALPAGDRHTVSARLNERVTELRRFNELNGAILASRLALNRGRLEALLSAANAGVYGAQGEVAMPATAARAAASA